MDDTTFSAAVEIVASEINKMHRLMNGLEQPDENILYYNLFSIYTRILSPLVGEQAPSCFAHLTFSPNPLAQTVAYYIIRDILSSSSSAIELLSKDSARDALKPTLCHSLLSFAPLNVINAIEKCAADYLIYPEPQVKQLGANLTTLIKPLPISLYLRLESLLVDPSPEVRYEAISSLINHGYPRTKSREVLQVLRTEGALRVELLDEIDDIIKARPTE
jgi:hypothetical protein